MATRRTPSRTSRPRTAVPIPTQATVIDTPVVDELRTSFLAYALSVIMARALPDARDGLKPVHRRILYSLYAQNIRPDSPYKKSSRVVGDTMGKYHPHGDSAIYEALVRLAQDFAMRVPLVDPHGNFGSLDDSPAASRYTECRLAHPGLALLDSLDENTVDFQDNYDGTETEPSVLPCGYPNLLVNGSTGVAVGMATNIPPHNLAEVVAAAKMLLADPKVSVKDLCKALPAPDFPTGGEIVNATDMYEMYATGKGAVLVRAKAMIVDLPRGRKGIEVTELPYMVGPEKVIARTRELIGEKRLEGIADARDYTDRKTGLKILFEIKPGFDPVAVLGELYRLTPMEDSFAASFVALIDGTPQVCSVKDLLGAYLAHRIEVVRRRSTFRLDRATRRLHLVEGLRRALDMIDEIVAMIRASKDTDTARRRLVRDAAFTEAQANHILEMPLRRLTSLEAKKLDTEYAELRKTITELQKLLASRARLAAQVGTELDEVAARFASPRRTARTVSHRVATTPPAAGTDTNRSLELQDAPTTVVLLDGDVLARVPHDSIPPALLARQVVHTTLRATVLAVGHDGVVRPVSVHALPEATAPKPPTLAAVLATPGISIAGVLLPDTLAVLGTKDGMVKRIVLDTPRTPTSVISLAPGDALIAALPCPDTVRDLVFVTQQGQVLRFPASSVRPQQRGAAGMTAINLVDDDAVIAVAAPPAADARLAVATDTGAVKFTPLEEVPVKGRATSGVRALRFLAGHSRLAAAAVGSDPRPRTRSGKALPPPASTRRDASAQDLTAPVAGFAHPVS